MKYVKTLNNRYDGHRVHPPGRVISLPDEMARDQVKYATGAYCDSAGRSVDEEGNLLPEAEFADNGPRSERAAQARKSA